MLAKLVALAIGFGRATLLGFGGGPSIVPLYEHEAVDVFHWTSRQEFGQTLGFANALPGPIATKLGIYIGYQVAGWPGAVVSLLAITLPTGLALIALYAVLSRFKESPYLKGMLSGIRPVIFVMLLMLAMDFAQYAFKPNGTGALSWLPFGLAAIYYISVQYLGLSPIWGVIGSLVAGAILLR